MRWSEDTLIATNMTDFTESPPAATVTDDDTCVTQYIEIVPLNRDTDGPCTTQCDSGDLSDEVKREVSEQIKEEPGRVLCAVTVLIIIFV